MQSFDFFKVFGQGWVPGFIFFDGLPDHQLGISEDFQILHFKAGGEFQSGYQGFVFGLIVGGFEGEAESIFGNKAI